LFSAKYTHCLPYVAAVGVVWFSLVGPKEVPIIWFMVGMFLGVENGKKMKEGNLLALS